ncbi:helix-turn-helix domain-containing protein [Hymenobacter metallilatus]|uniref:XRE family transcriptional regulator n=1 Tax=Hymenobacter metallilatus TaxID=2493666 RepID=A0A428JCX2_9BACT|nr:helix-turn-helix transcriptional regulator [Hymenobacter metallilatus]RSK29881.1 XRE family transcriptional regulator [Hymenobacter metallilatus]
MDETLFFNQRLRKRRAAARLTQAQTADALCITRQCYASYEEARAEPPLRVLLLMAALFACTLDELVGFDAAKTSRPLVQPTAARKPGSGRKPKTPRRPSPSISSLPSNRPFAPWP